jgi:hypothetical protein
MDDCTGIRQVASARERLLAHAIACDRETDEADPRIDVIEANRPAQDAPHAGRRAGREENYRGGGPGSPGT